MKTFATTIIIASFCIIAIVLCVTTSNQPPDRHNIGDVLSRCEGHAIVVAKGFNSGNFEAYQHYLLIRDDDMNVYEYYGAKFDIEVGDTLK